ncbi:hypothetical protein LOAG_13801 [Loa loa]|uniref:Uncharacterized protein n=1 Tax=Loa loa TaxID=7209 RepID=A0A1S0TIV9_LOALO|nr:hypothetical protein LOAG_13801 [Loa loa]EFO14715.1 hypothetical protein LOAG_13801 [Loa loa]
MTDIRIKMDINNTADDIHATVINKKPITIISQDQQYRYNGYAGHITLDLTDNDSSKVTNVKFTQMPQIFQRNSKISNFLINHRNELYSETYVDQSREGFFRSNTEIFNQILKIRKDIDSLRRYIGKVNEFLQHINANLSEYNTNIIQLFDKTTFVDNSKGDNFRFHQITDNFLPKGNIYTGTTKPTYIAFPRAVSIINPILMSHLQANAATSVLAKGTELRSNVDDVDDGDITNSTRFPEKHSVESDQRISLNGKRFVESIQNGQLYSLIKNGIKGNQNQFVANDSNDRIKMRIIEGFNRKTDEIYQKSAINDNHRIKNETFMNKNTNNEKVLPNITVTEAYQPFSIRRYSARSKTNFDKQINKLINFNTLKSLTTTHQLLNPIPITSISDDTFQHSTTLSSSHLSPSTGNDSQFEFGNNSYAVILSFASPTVAKTSGQATTTQTPLLLTRNTVSNIVVTIITDTVSTSTTTTTTTNTTTILSATSTSAITTLTTSTTTNTTTTTTTNTTTTTTATSTTTATNTITTTTIATTTTTATSTTTATTLNAINTTSTTISTTVTSPTSETIGPTLGFDKITRRNLDTMPPLIPLKPNFFGSNFDGIFVPWFNDPQLTLWPERLFGRRK